MTVLTSRATSAGRGVLKRLVFSVQRVFGAFAFRYDLIRAGMTSGRRDRRLYWAEPEILRLYLQTAGWKRHPPPTDGNARRVDVWVLPCTDGTYEVIVPSSRDTRDFDRVVAELLRTVAISENRRRRDVIAAVQQLDRISMFAVMDPELAAERTPLPQSGSSLDGPAEAEARRLELGREWATVTAEHAFDLHQHPGSPYTGEWADARRVLAKARSAVVPSLADDDARLLLGYTSAVNEELFNHDKLFNHDELSAAHNELLKQLNVVGVTKTVLEKRVEADATTADYFWRRVNAAALPDPAADGIAATAPAV